MGTSFRGVVQNGITSYEPRTSAALTVTAPNFGAFCILGRAESNV